MLIGKHQVWVKEVTELVVSLEGFSLVHQAKEQFIVTHVPLRWSWNYIYKLYQRKVDMDTWNAVKSVLADVSSISPSSEQRGLKPTDEG